MHRNQGFTLIELITVIAIIALVAGIVMPSVTTWLPKYRLRSGAEEIQSALQLARLGAIKQNTNSVVAFDTANHTFRATINGQMLKFGKMPAGITIDSITSPAGKVEFDSRGLANASSGDIQVKNNLGGTKTITVNIVGNAKIN